MQANRITLEQGSPEWLSFRQGKISASKAPIILGLSPYQTPYGLYEEEMGLREPQKQQAHMTRGLDIEDTVRDWFFSTTRINVQLSVVQHPTNPIFIASLDGISDNGATIVEIKNNNEEYHLMAKNDKIPPHYYCQMQMQMYVTGLELCHYLSHRQDDIVHIVVKRDNDFITDMIVKLLDFKRRLNDFDPPPLSDRDYEDMSADDVFKDLMDQYGEDTRMIKALTERADRFKKDIVQRIGDKNAKGSNWKVTKYSRQGHVNYEAMVNENCPDVDLNKYRKSGNVSYRITVE